MDITITCPLGSQCEEIKDNKLHRCAWYVEMKGIDASGDEHDEWKCATAWQPLLMVETSSQIRGTNASIQSMRNVTAEKQDAAIQALQAAAMNQTHGSGTVIKSLESDSD